MSYKLTAKRLPKRQELYDLLRAIRDDWDRENPEPEYEDDEEIPEEEEEPPYLDITIGWNPETGGWSYQTGDNSFTGGAYGYPIWAVGSVNGRESNDQIEDLVDELRQQLDELAP